MPARTNSFQRLVRAIQGHVSKAGTVTESRMLTDRDTGNPVEVDIVIQELVGGHEVLIGIECTSGRRKATLEWYREMRGKHRDLPISKTVLVSKSGFSADVHEKARLDNITLLSLKAAHTFEWQPLLAKLQGGSLAEVSFPLRELALEWPEGSGGPPDGLSPTDLVVQAAGRSFPLPQFAMLIAQEIGFTKGIMANLELILKQTDHASFGFRLPDGALTTRAGQPLDGLLVTATFSIHPRVQTVDWQPVEFNGQTVATATLPAEFLFPGSTGDSVMTVSRDQSAEMTISLLGPADKDMQLDVFPNALWSPASVAPLPPPEETT